MLASFADELIKISATVQEVGGLAELAGYFVAPLRPLVGIGGGMTGIGKLKPQPRKISRSFFSRMPKSHFKGRLE